MENIYKKYEKLIKNSAIKVSNNEKEKTIFEITRYPYREKVSSNLFAFYFDINEEHNLQDIFLKALFKVISKKWGEEHTISYNTDELIVEPEYKTESGKFIDIVLSNSNFIIGIENKIGAEVYNDLVDYYKTLEGENKDTYAVVLSANNLSREDEEKIKNSQFEHILYSELFDEVDELLKQKQYSKNKWIEFYEEFKETIRRRYDKNMEIDNDFKEFYSNNNRAIEEFTSCLCNVKQKLNRRVDKLGELLVDKLKEDKYVVGHWNYSKNNITQYDPFHNLFTISNIYLKELKLTIDNVITPNDWYIQIYTRGRNKEKSKIINILNRNNIKCKDGDKDHISLEERYKDEDYEGIIEKDIELIKIFDKELNSKNIKG